jgi:hypothetical protein
VSPKPDGSSERRHNKALARCPRFNNRQGAEHHARNVYWIVKGTINGGKLSDLESVRDEMVATVNGAEPNTLNYE